MKGKPIILITTYFPSDCSDTEALHLSHFEYYQYFWNYFITGNGHGILCLTVLRNEKLFHLSFCVNNQNICVRSTENSHSLWRNIARPEVDVWCAMSWRRIILPTLFSRDIQCVSATVIPLITQSFCIWMGISLIAQNSNRACNAGTGVLQPRDVFEDSTWPSCSDSLMGCGKFYLGNNKIVQKNCRHVLQSPKNSICTVFAIGLGCCGSG